jgi:hypothetical protein
MAEITTQTFAAMEKRIIMVENMLEATRNIAKGIA